MAGNVRFCKHLFGHPETAESLQYPKAYAVQCKGGGSDYKDSQQLNAQLGSRPAIKNAPIHQGCCRVRSRDTGASCKEAYCNDAPVEASVIGAQGPSASRPWSNYT